VLSIASLARFSPTMQVLNTLSPHWTMSKAPTSPTPLSHLNHLEALP
jgi:hypothetical protein